MLIVLSKWPRKAAERVPDKIKFKQLLELGQLVCSTEISSSFKAFLIKTVLLHLKSQCRC